MGRPADPGRARRGTGHRPKPGGEVVHLGAVPDLVDLRPDWAAVPLDLPVGAVPVWERLIDGLLVRGLKPEMLEGVRALAVAGWRARQAATEIEDRGLLVDTERGLAVNPAVRVEKDAVATWVRVAAEFGITPAAQMRLGLMQLAGESLLQSLNRDLDAGAGS